MSRFEEAEDQYGNKGLAIELEPGDDDDSWRRELRLKRREEARRRRQRGGKISADE